jgi:hypothetical protein
MLKRPQSFTRILAFCFPLVLVAGCGSENGIGQGSIIWIFEQSKTWNVGWSDPTDPNFAYTTLSQPFLVTIRTPSGPAAAFVDITLSLDLSLGTITAGSEVMYLWVDEDGDGVYETGPVISPYRTRTNYAGNKPVRVDTIVGGALSYRGLLYAYSGPHLETAEIEVKCVPPSGMTPPPC